ncbi:MAG: T9SS type A sorting domain-containing protein [Candidatus Krumholzibacteria bacterium]|nr:T9SS type A sorting domain-containing protein [Candidatus Krumholzibacteria bacterium]
MSNRCVRLIVLLVLVALLLPAISSARNPFRNDFFDRYPGAENTFLDDVPSNKGHCGVCHFDFDGSDARNPYGLSIEVRLSAGMTAAEAVVDVENDDADGDGFSNLVEITDTINWSNTPTFPGLSTGNVGSAVNVDLADLLDYLTPTGSTDSTPPEVTITSPVGGEMIPSATYNEVTWTATDAGGISHVDLYLSGDGGATFKAMAKGVPNDGTYQMFFPNLPSPNSILRVEAYDNAGNDAYDDSPVAFTIIPVTHGVVPTTLRDFDLGGTNPFEGSSLDDPSVVCIQCHGGYDTDTEHWHNWQGSMMGQAMRDPLYMATVAVAEEVVPAVGDLCLRCHTPGGWQEGRSFDTSGAMLTDKDLQGVQCDYCHRMVDPVYVPGVSPAGDDEIIADLDLAPLEAANGEFVTDPDPIMRGPYDDAAASHQFLDSNFHRTSQLCGTCHDVSNPAFVAGDAPGKYDVHALDTPHPDGDRRNMVPVERTFSEWEASEYASTGVYQPQFAGDKPDGIVSTCQDCHMRDVTGVGSNVPSSPTRTDLGLHDLTGGNTFLPDILPIWFPELDTAALQDGKLRAIAMLSLAATMDLTITPVDGQPAVTVRITNETGHKLPSGYPEGRRMWLNIKAYDASDVMVYESGHYDNATGVLSHDEDAKIYHIEPGISARLAPIIGMEAGPSFFFPLSDTVYSDNRIPPRGFTNAAFVIAQSPVVAYSYEDGQYWDDTEYILPITARRVDVTYYYQTTSKEYMEFLVENNHTNDLSQQVYDAWNNNGKSTPIVVAQQSALLDVSAAPEEQVVPRITTLAQNYPNPFNPQTWIDFSLPSAQTVSLRIYDERGALVRTLVDGLVAEGENQVLWDGKDNGGRSVASGVYYYVLKSNSGDLRHKMTLIR